MLTPASSHPPDTPFALAKTPYVAAEGQGKSAASAAPEETQCRCAIVQVNRAVVANTRRDLACDRLGLNGFEAESGHDRQGIRYPAKAWALPELGSAGQQQDHDIAGLCESGVWHCAISATRSSVLAVQ